MTACFGLFTLDSDQRTLARAGTDVHLTPKAFDLLVLLVGEAPRVVRKNELHERLWPGTFVSDATLLGLVKELRRALADRDAESPLIRTAHRVGYAFSAPIEKSVGPQPAVSRWIVAGGRRIALTEGENLIGRDPAAVVRLDATGVSRRHACITVQRNRAVLRDLESKNGTSVNDVALCGAVTLQDDSRIQIGPILIVFHAAASGMSTETLTRIPARVQARIGRPP